MNENKFDSLHIDLDKWIFELNGEHMKKCSSITFLLENHVAIAILKINEETEKGETKETTMIYKSKVKPRPIIKTA